MEINLALNNSEIITCSVLLLGTIVFIAYWFIAQSERLKNWFYKKWEFDIASRKHIFFTKYIGLILLGIIPLCFVTCVLGLQFDEVGLSINPETTQFSIVWILVLSVLVIPLAYFSAKQPKNLVNYPQIRAKKWTRKTFYINLIGWAVYLLGYELLFRGVFLFPLVDQLGIAVAVSINVLFYAISHVPKGLSETIGAIPLGFVLCVLTIMSGTIWIAFFVHISLSFTNSLTALAHHPEITYGPWTKKTKGTND